MYSDTGCALHQGTPLRANEDGLPGLERAGSLNHVMMSLTKSMQLDQIQSCWPGRQAFSSRLMPPTFLLALTFSSPPSHCCLQS